MLASQLIQSLEAAIEEHGDLEVMAEVPSEPLFDPRYKQLYFA